MIDNVAEKIQIESFFRNRPQIIDFALANRSNGGSRSTGIEIFLVPGYRFGIMRFKNVAPLAAGIDSAVLPTNGVRIPSNGVIFGYRYARRFGERSGLRVKQEQRRRSLGNEDDL